MYQLNIDSQAYNTIKQIFKLSMVLFASFFIADMAMAAAAPTLPGVTTSGAVGGDIATNTSAFFNKYGKYIVYGTGFVTFVIASFWIIGSVNDWRAGKPGGSLGNVAIVFFIAILVTVIVMYLLSEGLKILDAAFV